MLTAQIKPAQTCRKTSARCKTSKTPRNLRARIYTKGTRGFEGRGKTKPRGTGISWIIQVTRGLTVPFVRQEKDPKPQGNGVSRIMEAIRAQTVPCVRQAKDCEPESRRIRSLISAQIKRISQPGGGRSIWPVNCLSASCLRRLCSLRRPVWGIRWYSCRRAWHASSAR